MLQTIDDELVYVVEFDTLPKTPIEGLTDGEQAYNRALYGWNNPQGFGMKTPPPGSLARLMTPSMTYAQALTDALDTGVITEPGKYGIHLDRNRRRYEIFKIVE